MRVFQVKEISHVTPYVFPLRAAANEAMEKRLREREVDTIENDEPGPQPVADEEHDVQDMDDDGHQDEENDERPNEENDGAEAPSTLLPEGPVAEANWGVLDHRESWPPRAGAGRPPWRSPSAWSSLSYAKRCMIAKDYAEECARDELREAADYRPVPQARRQRPRRRRPAST